MHKVFLKPWSDSAYKSEFFIKIDKQQPHINYSRMNFKKRHTLEEVESGYSSIVCILRNIK